MRLEVHYRPFPPEADPAPRNSLVATTGAEDPGKETVDFHGEKRPNQTHASKIDPARTADSMAAKVFRGAHLVVVELGDQGNAMPEVLRDGKNAPHSARRLA